jgi:hypothetical protein
MTDWIAAAKDALAHGRDYHKVAAAALHEASHELTQKSIAQAIGRDPSWVCRILKWYRAGCPTDTVFGPEAAVRRAIATSQSAEPDSPSAEELGQLVLDLGEEGTSSYVPGQREATLKVIGGIAICRQFSKIVGDLSERDLELVLPAEDDQRREILRTLVRELAKASLTVGCQLESARSAVKAARPPPMFEEMRAGTESATLPAV